MELDVQETGGVMAIYITPKSEGVQPSISFEMVAGPKRYARFWPEVNKLEWGWVLHESAQLVWSLDAPSEV